MMFTGRVGLRSGLLILFLVNVGFTFSQRPEKPNIIFIMTDDQSPFAVDGPNSRMSRPFGFNKESRVYTPTIDSLAKNGIIFNRAYVSSSMCAPSRYTTLTGRYAGRCEGHDYLKNSPLGELGRVQNDSELEEDKMNMARYLKEAGYKTALIGKSHLVDHDVLGDESYSLSSPKLMKYAKNADPKDPTVDRAMKHNYDYWVRRHREFGFDVVDAISAVNLRELFNDSLNAHNIEWKNKAVLDFLDNAGDDPFFIYYSETVPHGPAPWIRRGGKYVHGLDANPDFTSAGYIDVEYDNMPSRNEVLQEVKSMTGMDPDQAWLTWFDYSVKAIVKKLEEMGKLENTLIVITSDHGDKDFGKSTLYENGVKVPLAMFWPKGIQKGLVYDGLVQNVDFVPTFLELAGVDNLDELELDGVSIASTFDGSKKPVHDHLYFEMGYARAVMTQDWKYIAVRYDADTQRKIDKGYQFKGWQDKTTPKPYLVKNGHLGYHAALYHPFYFESDQLFHIVEDPQESQNMVLGSGSKLVEMKSILREYLQTFPNRPFGELLDI